MYYSYYSLYMSYKNSAQSGRFQKSVKWILAYLYDWFSDSLYAIILLVQKFVQAQKKHTGGSLVFFPQSSNSTIISYTYIYFSQYILNLVLQDPIYKVIVICTYILHPFIDNHWCIPFSEPKMITFLLMNIGNHTWTHWAIIFLFDIVVSCASIGN